MATRSIPRPFNPFISPELMNPIPIGAQPVPMQPPVPPMLASAPRKVPTTVEPMPQSFGASAAPVMPPMPDPAAPGGGFMGGMNDFLGSDASLAMAAGLLGGGSTNEAVGRGFSNVYAARNPGGGATPADLQLYAQAKREGYTGSMMEFLKEKDARAAGADLGLNPVYFRDENGNVRAAQLGKDGSIHPIDLPGSTIMGPGDKAADIASGKVLGEAEGTYQSMQSKMPGLEYVVSKLDQLADKATYTVGGQIINEAMRQSGMEPREAAVARAEYIAMVDNQILPLLRDTFGAQFTQREGETLRATLGDPNASPKEKQAILKAFIEQKRRDIEALAAQTGNAPASPTGPANADPLGIR